MSEVRLVIREADSDWSGTIHGSDAERAVAALSADPFTLDELEIAVSRFAKSSAAHRFFSNLQPSLIDEPYDAGVVVIDLAARVVMADSTYFTPTLEGSVQYHNGQCCTDTGIRFHLADDWKISTDAESWRPLADLRRQERTAKPPLDARAVFYGRPMLEFLARQLYAAFTQRKELAPPPQPDTPYYHVIKDIHAAWLLTPRDDLGGLCPREVALARNDHLGSDMQDRSEQWSMMDQCPRGLATTFHAYKFGGFGTHELVKYYDLIRALLWCSWDQITELAQSPKFGPRLESLTAGDFLAAEIPRLESLREQWLDYPDPECHGRTPRSIIERERARLPEGVFGKDAMVDPECPCCQMLADMPGPTFWHLDGCNNDDEFAFDINHATREEWEAERREWDEMSEKLGAEREERKRLGVADSYQPDESNGIWSSSFSVGDTQNVPLGIRVFGIGCHLAELIVGLREAAAAGPDAQPQIDHLNRDFGNLREILQSSDASLSAALIGPIIQRFAETLASVATAYATLQAQCKSLTTDLQKLLNPPSADPMGDSDIPF